MNRITLFATLFALAAGLLAPRSASAHCDGVDGPVVADAGRALDTGDLAPVLRWVRPQDEQELREAFQQARAVRGLGPEARALADRYFFETAVRLHRASEGAPYTGLKPAGRDLGPAIPAADRAIASGSSAELRGLLTRALREGLSARLKEVRARRRNADRSIADGRAYVAAYVEFVHYVERVHNAVAGSSSLHAPAEPHTESHQPGQ